MKKTHPKTYKLKLFLAIFGEIVVESRPQKLLKNS